MNDDLISRSELKKRFQAILDRGDMFCEYDIIGMVDNAPTVLHDNYAMGYQDGVNKVLSERSQGEWIPVSERLPDIAKKCILQLSDGYITMGTYHSIGKWTFIETSIAYVYGKETVIAWMPLPEAYKEAEDETSC